MEKKIWMAMFVENLQKLNKRKMYDSGQGRKKSIINL